MNQKGFTLIELLATIAVIGVVALGIASLFYNIQFVQRNSNYLDRATRAAQKEVEVLRNNSYNALTVGEDIDFSSELPDELPNGSTGTVVVTEPSPGLKRVDVTVGYNDGNKPQSVTLSSMIGVIGLSQ